MNRINKTLRYQLGKLVLAGMVAGASFGLHAQYVPYGQGVIGQGGSSSNQAYQPDIPAQATNPSPVSGYTPDGTLFMGGQKIGNPHQILHDLNVPSFFGVNANRLSFSDVPSYGQGTLAQMENHTLTIGVPAGNVVLSRLYLTPTNPYTQGVATPHNNYQIYQGVVADAQAGSYQLTVANDNKLYAFKTLGAMSNQSQNILIKELPAHSVFVANSDPNGGAVAVRVTQSGDYAAMQNYFATVKPYDFSWRSALAPYANNPFTADATGAFFTNWVLGSSQVQAYQANLESQSGKSGNEAFGVLAWDANQNKYVMLDATNVTATSGSVSGNMPTLGSGQTAFFGMHTHAHNSAPSFQDLKTTEQLGFDQVVIGPAGNSAIFTSTPSNNWQGQKFKFEGAYIDSISGAGYDLDGGPEDPKGVGGVSSGIADPYGRGTYIVGGNSGNSANGLILNNHGHVIGGDVSGNSDYQRREFNAMMDRYSFGFAKLLRAGYFLYSTVTKRTSNSQSSTSAESPTNAAEVTSMVENSATPWRDTGNFNVENESQLVELYNNLVTNGDRVASPTEGGASSIFADGTQVSLRVDSKTGGMTIDISRRSTGQSPIKVHVKPK